MDINDTTNGLQLAQGVSPSKNIELDDEFKKHDVELHSTESFGSTKNQILTDEQGNVYLNFTGTV